VIAKHQVQPDAMVSTAVSLYEREIAYQVLPREEYHTQKSKKQIKGSGPPLSKIEKK
jgi:hypothetical protein